MPLNSVLVWFFFYTRMGKWQGKLKGMYFKELDVLFLSSVDWTSYPEAWINNVTNFEHQHRAEIKLVLQHGDRLIEDISVRPRTVDLISLGQSKIIGISLQLQLYYFTETPSTSNLLCIWLTLLQTLLSSATGCTTKFHSRGIRTDNQLETSLTVHAETGKYCL